MNVRSLLKLMLPMALALSASGCCCDVLVFIPVQEVSAQEAKPGDQQLAPLTLGRSRSLLTESARTAAY